MGRRFLFQRPAKLSSFSHLGFSLSVYQVQYDGHQRTEFWDLCGRRRLNGRIREWARSSASGHFLPCAFSYRRRQSRLHSHPKNTGIESSTAASSMRVKFGVGSSSNCSGRMPKSGGCGGRSRRRTTGMNSPLSQLVPDAPAGAVLTQVALLHQGPEMLFERVAISARQSNRIVHGDAPMFACEFDDL